MIEIRNLTYHIGKSTILNDINLEIPRTGITALIGPNGAGKSTLLNLIAKLLPIQQGNIQVDDLDVSTTSPELIARKLAVLEQQNSITTRLKVKELVTFGRWPHHRGRPVQEDFKKIEEAMMLFELEDISGRYLDELSGGQRQRAFTAMCYAQSTDWLLLDEPLNNLDPRHAVTLMSRLHEMSRANGAGRSVVIVLHDINYAAVWADHIVILKDGKLNDCGTTPDVLNSKTLSNAYDAPIEVAEIKGRPVVLHHGLDYPN